MIYFIYCADAFRLQRFVCIQINFDQTFLHLNKYPEGQTFGTINRINHRIYQPIYFFRFTFLRRGFTNGLEDLYSIQDQVIQGME